MISPNYLSLGLKLLAKSGLPPLFSKQLRGLGSILCLHHVCPETKPKASFAPNSHLEVTPEFLSQLIQMVRDEGFETISLAQAINRIQSPNKKNKPFIVFTLDDGYKDNAVYAQPIFDRMQCPFAIFVTPKIVDGTCELWWRGLEQIITKSQAVLTKIGGRQYRFITTTVAEKETAWETLAPIFQKMPELEQRKIINEMALQHEVDLAAMCRSTAMTWDEVRKLKADPLCTIGAHSVNHYLIAKLPPEAATYELVQSKRIIETELGAKIDYFAYPYGDALAAGPRDFDLAKNAGFVASLTTRKGVIFGRHADHLQALPRIMISGRYQHLHLVKTLLTGMPTALYNGFRKLDIN